MLETPSGCTSRETLQENLDLETAENHRLRAVLLELASRPEITTDTRQWLAGKIRERGKTPIVRGLREDEREVTDVLRKWAGRLADVAQKVPEADQKSFDGQLLYGQLETYANQVQGALQECDQQFGRTFADLEEAR